MRLLNSFFQPFAHVRRPALGLLFTLATATMLSAQERTGTGYLSTWSGELNSTNGTLKNRGAELKGLSITVYECNAKTAMKLWKTEYATMGAKFMGSDPVKAVGMSLPEAPEVTVVFAHAVNEQKTGPAKLTLSFYRNDSTALEDQNQMQVAMRDLAVKLNRAVVQEQVNEQQKVVAKQTKKLGSAQKAHAKTLKQADKAAKNLDKSNKALRKLTSQQVDLQGDVHKYQSQYDGTKDSKELQKLVKAQKKLVKVNSKMAKELKNQAKAQKELNTRQEEMPDTQKDKDDRQSTQEKFNTDLQNLQRKLEAIH